MTRPSKAPPGMNIQTKLMTKEQAKRLTQNNPNARVLEYSTKDVLSNKELKRMLKSARQVFDRLADEMRQSGKDISEKELRMKVVEELPEWAKYEKYYGAMLKIATSFENNDSMIDFMIDLNEKQKSGMSREEASSWFMFKAISKKAHDPDIIAYISHLEQKMKDGLSITKAMDLLVQALSPKEDNTNKN